MRFHKSLTAGLFAGQDFIPTIAIPAGNKLVLSSKRSRFAVNNDNDEFARTQRSPINGNPVAKPGKIKLAW